MGGVDVPFAELAELDMPRIDWWNAYFEQVALLTPDCKLRLMRLQSLDGLRATVSPDRVQVMPWGDQNNQDYVVSGGAAGLVDGCAFSTPYADLDAAVLRAARGAAVARSNRRRLGFARRWRSAGGRESTINVQGGPLISGGKEFGWGLGTQAYTELEFPLPACAVSFRSTVGLDKVVGKGGCARAIVYAQKAEGQPLYRSDHLIGSDKVVDTGVLPLNAAVPDPQLVIVSHPDSSDRPAGADPLDIRDVVDWLEPQLNLDLEKLRAEVRSRLLRLLPGLGGLDRSPGARMVAWSFANRWDANTQSFHFEFRPEAAAVTLTRSVRIEPDQNWLLLYVSRNADGKCHLADSGRDSHRRQAGRRVRRSTRVGGPIRRRCYAGVDKFHDRQVALEVRLVSRGDNSFVDWRSLAIVDRLPTLFEVFEDEVQRPIKLTAVGGEAAVVTIDRYSGTACIKVSGNDARGVLSNLSPADPRKSPIRRVPLYSLRMAQEGRTTDRARFGLLDKRQRQRLRGHPMAPDRPIQGIRETTGPRCTLPKRICKSGKSERPRAIRRPLLKSTKSGRLWPI